MRTKLIAAIRAAGEWLARENCRYVHKSAWSRPAKGKRSCPKCGRRWNKGGYTRKYLRNSA